MKGLNRAALARSLFLGFAKGDGAFALRGTTQMVVAPKKPDRRKSLRVRFLKSARIVFNSRRSVINCTVRNMSATGALLAVPSVVGIPNEFELAMDFGVRSAKVVWKSERTVGVVWTRTG
jgi:hypothetical protein